MEGIKNPHGLRFNPTIDEEYNPRPVKVWRDGSDYYMTLGGVPEIMYQVHIARESSLPSFGEWYSEPAQIIGNIHDPNIIEKVETVVRTFLNADSLDAFKKTLRKLTHKKKHKKVTQ